MGHVAEVTGVPIKGQKLIVNGRALTSMDNDKRIPDCRISPGCKVMLLGKKHDPSQDEVYQKVLTIQKKTILDYTNLLKVTPKHRWAWPSAPGRGCISLQIPDPTLAFGQGGSIVVSK